MDRNSVCSLHAAVMKSSEHPCCCFFVSSRGFLREAFQRGGPDGSSARLMRGEITFSQVRGHFINPLRRHSVPTCPSPTLTRSSLRADPPCLPHLVLVLASQDWDGGFETHREIFKTGSLSLWANPQDSLHEWEITNFLPVCARQNSLFFLLNCGKIHVIQNLSSRSLLSI